MQPDELAGEVMECPGEDCDGCVTCEEKPVRGDLFFNHVVHDENDRQQIAGVRAMFRELRDCVVEFVPEGRERSLALTNLQQAMMWAVAACVAQCESSEAVL